MRKWVIALRAVLGTAEALRSTKESAETSRPFSREYKGVTLKGEVYSDGSGAPATASVDGFMFSLDYLGAPKLRALSSPSGSLRRGRKVAVSRVTAAYAQFVKDLPDAWVKLNHEMYTPAP